MMRTLLRRLRRRATRGQGVMHGRLDGIDARGLGGWATVRAEPMTVEILSGENVLMVTQANLARPDVAAAGAGPLNCGFCLDMEQLTAAALRLGVAPERAPLRLVVNGTEMPSSLSSLDAGRLVEASALSWFKQLGGVA